MLKMLKNGQTSVIVRVKLRSSASAVGAGLTGLTSASSGLIVATVADNESATTRYRASSSEIESITTLGTFAAPTSGKCRFKEVDATNHPGLYEIQIADARWAVSGAKSIIVSILGASNLVETDLEIQLNSIDLFDSVRAGLTALPNAAAEAAGGLFTRGTGAGQIRQDANGRIDINVKAYGDSAGTFAGGKPDVNVASYASGQAPLQPTTAGRTLDVAATGEAGLDFDNVKDASSAHTLSNITVPTVTTLTNAPSDSSGVTTLLSRLSATRAGYLDNLSAGAVALEASLQGLITTIGASAAGVASAVWGTATRTLTAFGFSVTVGTNNDKTGYALTSGERTSIANEVEAQIIDETDSEKVLTAITDKIAAVNPDLSGLTVSAIASAVWSAVTRTLTSGANIALAKGSGVTGFNDLDAAGVRSAVGLGSANLDTQLAAKATAAALATTDGKVDAIKTKTDNLPSDPADESLLEAAITSATSTLATAATLALVKAKTDGLPSDPADASDITSAFASVISAIAALNDISTAEVLAQVNTALTTAVADSVAAVGDRPSPAQALYLMAQFLRSREVVGTTMTVKTPGGSALTTMTLNDADSPTAYEQAS